MIDKTLASDKLESTMTDSVAENHNDFYNRYMYDDVSRVLKTAKDNGLCIVIAVQCIPDGPVTRSILIPDDREKIDLFLQTACVALAPINSKYKLPALKYLLRKIKKAIDRGIKYDYD